VGGIFQPRDFFMTLHAILFLALLPAVAARGQALMGPSGSVYLLPSDAAILEGNELRTDLPCTVKQITPELGFDLGFHSGYEVSVPFQYLAGSGNELTAVFRVIPEEYPDKTMYFSQKWEVPPLLRDAKGTAYLRGEFRSGPGKYQVEWLMRDREERFCSARWQISAEPRGKDKDIELQFPRGIAAPERADSFGSEPPVMRDVNHAFKVVVLLNVASQAPGSASMRNTETAALLSILRSIAREPRIGSYSISAFNLDRNEVLFRSENAPQVDFPALGAAIKQAHLGTIDVQRLRQNDAGIQFLRGLLAEAMRMSRPDALIFVGPKTTTPEYGVRGALGALKEFGEPSCPVFYLNYNADPVSNPWRDMIGSVVKLWRGFEYSISRPRDLPLAWTEVMSRIGSRQPAPSPLGPTAAMTGLAAKK